MNVDVNEVEYATIVKFKEQANKTNIDLREKLSLNASDLLVLRQCTCLLEEEEQFKNIMMK